MVPRSPKKCLFKPEYSKIKGITKSNKSDSHARCVPCSSDINMAATGKTAIDLHLATKKHKDAASVIASNQSVAAFLPNLLAPTAIDDKTAAAEGSWAYHIVKHQQSFASADCVSARGLFQTMFSDSAIAKKFGSARTKTVKIITGVLAPYATKCLLENLGEQPFSISTDASNHKAVKLFPLVIRFFHAKLGVQVRLLDMKTLPGESSEMVTEFIEAALAENALDVMNLISFCADNAPVNFGGRTQGGNNNIFARLKEKVASLVPVGCPAHILHNSAKKSAEGLPFDIEALVFKLESYFKGSTSRHEKFKEYCEFVEVNGIFVFAYSCTNKMDYACGCNAENVEALGCFAIALLTYIKYASYAQRFFSSAESKVVVVFLHSILSCFQHPLLSLQKSNALLPELMELIRSLQFTIRERRNSRFFGAMTEITMRQLEFDKAQRLKEEFIKFYDTALEYIDAWFQLERFPTNIQWIMLATRSVQYKEVKKLAEQISPELAEQDSLFDEVSQLNAILQQVPLDVFESLNAEEKWIRVFKENCTLPGLYELVSKILSIPISNAFVERVFSLCGNQWTDDRNLLQPETVKCLLQVNVNFDHTCVEMFSLLLNDRKLLNDVRSWEKYNV